MARKRRFETVVALLMLGVVPACGGGGGNSGDSGGTVTPDATADSGAGVDGGQGTPTDLGMPGTDVPPDAAPCPDQDHDIISDAIEGAPTLDTDGDGIPDYLDTDSDNDGFMDIDEGRRGYPGYTMATETWYACGMTPDNCDGDALPNQRDLDSDNDGLTDAEELRYRTNPCVEDTDGDGYSDLVEVVAGSDPLDPHSTPPASSIYVTVPYYAPGLRGPHVHKQFTFQTRIRQADVFFVVDNSASMDHLIASLRTSLATTIVPGIQAAIPDARFGVGSFDSMPEGDPAHGIPGDGNPGGPGMVGDYTFWLRQRMTTDVASVQHAFDGMHTIAVDTMGEFLGADPPEDQIEALYETIVGSGSRTHEMDAAAVRSTTNALDATGDGWAGAVNAARDCPGSTHPFGWACFEEGRVPIIVLASDSPWYDGPDPTSPVSQYGHRYPDLAAAMVARGAFFVGIDVSTSGTSGPTYGNSVRLALATRTLNAMRQQVVFATGASGLDAISSNIVSAVTTLASQSRQDITTTLESDPMEHRLGTHATADFIRAVTPQSGMPAAPDGYDRSDGTTFFSVLPTTRVTFDVDFYNDFLVGGMAAQLFQATIVVHGRANSEVDRRPVYIVVPALGGGLPPG